MKRIERALIALPGLMFVNAVTIAEPEVCYQISTEIVDGTSQSSWGPIVGPKLGILRKIGCKTDYVSGTGEPKQCDRLRRQILHKITVGASPEAANLALVMKAMACMMGWANDDLEPAACHEFVVAGGTSPQLEVGAAILGIMGDIGCKPEK